MTLPPHPDRWAKGILTLFPSKDGSGHEGTMTLGDRHGCIHIRGWVKVSGHVVFEYQHSSDAEMEALVENLTGAVQG